MDKNFVDKKFFFDLVKDARSKNLPTKYALINIVTFHAMFPNMAKELNYLDELIKIDGVKIQLSIYSKQEVIYLSGKKFDVKGIEENFKLNNIFTKN
jgi:hypothetical protein